MAYLKELRRTHKALASIMSENVVKATCSACQRTFWAAEAFVSVVQSGKIESLCGACDGSHEEAK